LNTDHVSATGDNALVRNAFAMLGQRSGLFSAIVLLCHPASAAHASGHLPPIPIPRQEFKDIAACHAFLDETYRQDLAKADPKSVQIEGSTRQTLIDSKGPVSDGPTHSAYDVTEGWQVYHADPEAGYLKISYSYRTTKMTCEGRVLTGTHSQGYHTPRMEKLPQEGRLQ
jgi:hypothetical protein